MYRFLLSRRWVILTLVAVALIPAMIKLGFWQLHRHQARVAHNQLIAESLAAPPVPVTKLTGVGEDPAAEDRFRSVTATGTYDTEHEVVVRQRTASDDQSIGYFVLTPLVREDGTVLLVNRGWIPAGQDLTRFPDVPPPPEGEVTVTGRIMADETTENSGIERTRGLPPRQVMLINSDHRAKAMDRPVLDGHVQLTNSSPEPSGEHPQRLGEPDHDSIGPHMAYAVQWWLFTAAVPVGWFILVRRERRDQQASGQTNHPSKTTETSRATETAEPAGTTKTATATATSETSEETAESGTTGADQAGSTTSDTPALPTGERR